MKYFLLLSLIIFTCTDSICQSTIELDNKNGYKDLKFDMPIDTVIKKSKAKKISFINSDEATYYEIRNSDYKSFGGHVASVYIIKYNLDTSFYGLSFYFNKKDKGEFSDLVLLFTSMYGDPTKKDDLSYIYKWTGSLSELTLKFDYINESTSMMLVNLDVENKIQALKLKKMEKTKSEF